MRSIAVRAIAMACLFLVPAATPAAAEAPLSLRAAIERALAAQPELAGFVFELRAQDARIRQAALGPAPELDLSLEDAGGSGDRRGLDAAQTTLGLSQLVELGGKRAARTELAQSALGRLHTEQAARQLDVIAEVARRFVAALAQQARVAAAQESVRLAERTGTAVEQRVQAAAAPLAERSRAAVATAEAHLELEDAEHELATARHALAAAIGIAGADFGALEGDLLTLPVSRPFDSLVTQLRQSPDFLRFADEARLRDAELRLAERQRRADLRAHAGLRHYADGDDVALVAGLTLPLFAARRAEPQMGLARSGRERLDSERESAWLKSQARLFALYQEQEHARHVIRTLQERVLPQLEQALVQTEHAYRRGRYSYLEWSEAQRVLLGARLRLIDTAADFHSYRIDIERLTGASLTQAGALP